MPKNRRSEGQGENAKKEEIFRKTREESEREKDNKEETFIYST